MERIRYTDSIYEGEWDSENEEKHGKGKLTFSNLIFDGTWKHDLIHGIGTITYKQPQTTKFVFIKGLWDQGELLKTKILNNNKLSVDFSDLLFFLKTYVPRSLYPLCGFIQSSSVVELFLKNIKQSSVVKLVALCHAEIIGIIENNRLEQSYPVIERISMVPNDVISYINIDDTYNIYI
jgi:hypothetical protein